MKLSKSILLFVMCVTIIPLYSQIVIDWTEIPQNIGTHWTDNGNDSVTVDLGSTGGPQTWYFISQPMGPENTDAIIVPISSTPFADSFPNANVASKIYSDGDTVYCYGELVSYFSSMLGMGIVFPDTVFYRFDPVDSVPLPINYGSNRHYHFTFSMEIDTNTSLVTDNYGTEVIDAYGTVIIPYGSFECLRACSFDTIVTTLLYNGVPIVVDTTTHIIYDFYAENYGLIAHILSYPEETNPNYTDALFLERLIYFATGIEEFATFTKNSFSLHPNPFSDYLTINYSLTKIGDVYLRMYDINGRLIKTIINTSQPQGNYSLRWYGRDENGNSLPNGVYFYHLKVDDANFMGKILLIK
ncbi:T9SS type A sorting domain-containing protein [candidate division WOR-3 bacterium]|nr:T9SS type A sorting domain-containing protein [candidate division WOR-3 bacterium]